MVVTVGAILTKIGEVVAKGVEKAAEAKEIALKEIPEGSQILQPNLEVIESQSLESIIQSNIEKAAEAAETSPVELQPLPEELVEKLKAEGILSDNAIEALRVDNEGNLVLKCINEKLAGQTHEITGVPYVDKTIEVGSVKIKVIVPEFPTKFAIDIPKEIWREGDQAIFKHCTEQLREAIQSDPELAKQFTLQQLEQIMAGEPYIKGLTWHHSEIPGRMELVETRIHALSGHTGGNSIWCGGIR